VKISAFIYGLTWGGATRRLLTLLEEFVRLGHQVELVVVDKTGPLKGELSGKIRVKALDPGLLRPLWPFLSRRARMSLSKFALARYFRQARTDVFLSAANHAHITALSAKVLARSQTPFVLRLSSHVTASLKKSRKLSKRVRFLQAKRLYPLADRIVAVSKAVAEDLKQVIDIPKERVRVVYNPVVTPKLLEMASRAPDHPWLRDERGRDVPVLVAAGRLRRQKGFSTIIEAVSMASSGRKMKLIILGEGKDRGRLETLARDLGILELVDMPGFVPNPISYMARADLFCHASTFEGLPGVVVEALATGCPVVCTDSPGGAAEILGHGRFGILVPLNDIKAYSRAIIKALETKWNSEKLKERAREFSLEKAVAGYLNVFEELTSKKNV